MEKQEHFWSGEFGDSYTDRNDYSQNGLDELYMKNFGVSRTDLNKEFIAEMNKEMKVLEVGCNTGMQLGGLKNMGFGNLFGIDVSKAGLKIAKQNLPEANIMEASALDIPFKDKHFDMVYTSGVLIHINPNDLDKVIDEIYRLSNKYIWGFEYFSDDLQEIDYRGNKGVLWKNDFMKVFLERHPDLRVVKEKKIGYKDSENVDHMFLLEKTN